MGTDIIAAGELYDELQASEIQISRYADGLDPGRILLCADQCTVVKENPRRQVYRIRAEGRNYFFKRATVVRGKDRLRLTLLPNRKSAEWRNLHRLAARGVAAPRPLARGEAWRQRPPRMFLLTLEVEGSALVLESAAAWERLGEFVARLHRRGIYHSDLHPENLRLTPGGGHALLDAQSVFFWGWLPRFVRIRNIGRLMMHCPSPLLAGGSRAFLDGYNPESSSALRGEDLVAAAEKWRERQYRSRTRRCRKNSTEFSKTDGPGLRGYRRRGFDWGPAELEAAVAHGRPLKSGKVFAYRGVCVKRARLRRFHRDRCRNSWIMSRALEVRRIDVPRSLAYLTFGRTSYFVSEYLDGGRLLNDYLASSAFAAVKREALMRLARWVRRVHSNRVWQRDLKSSNIMHRGGRYYMLDLDSVRIRPVGEEQRLTNLAQLHASVGNAVGLKDRLRFFHYYTAEEPWPRERRRRAYRRIRDISRRKNTANYGLDLDRLK